MVNDLAAAGIRISAKKAHVAPYVRMDFLGLTVDLSEKAFVIPDSKLSDIRAAATDLLPADPSAPSTMTLLQSLVGRVAFAAVACPWLRFFVASLSRRLSPSARSPRWSAAEEEELLWWAESALPLLSGRLWRWRQTAATKLFARYTSGPVPSFHGRCDASDTGVGLRYGTEAVWSEPLPDWLPPSSPSSARELYGVCRLVEAGSFPRGAVIRIQCDNQGAVFTAMGSSAAPGTARVARRFFAALLDHDVTVIVEWVPREEMVDVDEGSRWDASDLAHAMIPPAIRRAICDAAFGVGLLPDVLFFSSPHTRWAAEAAFGSRLPEPGSAGDGIDSPAWESVQRGWAYPPFALLLPVLRRVLNLLPLPKVVLILPDTPYVRIVLHRWGAVSIPRVLSPPQFSTSLVPSSPIAAFISPSLSPHGSSTTRPRPVVQRAGD